MPSLADILRGSLTAPVDQPQSTLASLLRNSPGALSTPRGALSSALMASEPQQQSYPENPSQTYVVQQAMGQFPYLKDKNISSVVSPPDEGEGRGLEYWGPGDKGWDWKGKHYDRPAELPLDSHGVQLFDKNVRPIDILGDYVSHHAVNSDPQLSALYKQFTDSVPDQKMRDRYKWHQENSGEDTPYDQWKKDAGMPELFRGYTFNQWGDKAKNYYTPQQLQILDKVRQHLGIK